MPQKTSPTAVISKPVALPGSGLQPQAQPGLATLLVGGADNCAAPDAILGAGPFAFNNNAATTGVQGQSEALCVQYGIPGITNDVWFTWQAAGTGSAFLDLCGTASMDSKVAIYNGNTCPGAPALACNDDSCTLQSRVRWCVTAGSNYVIQLGNYPSAPSSTGTFSITETGPAPGNDDCSTATAISGPGSFVFDNTFATTSCQGQNNLACLFFESSTITNDVWFDWTSTFNGFAVAKTCALTGVDTKVAAYSGAGCPTGAALACNDDICASFQSSINFPVTNGLTYSIQIGTYPNNGGAPGGPGSIDIQPPPPGDECSAPITISGSGPHNFDQTAATTGSQGQAESNCNYFGYTTVDSDLWYTWMAPSSGEFEITTLGQTVIDTKVAVYNGSGCPTGPAINCGDDSCNTFQSTIGFNAVGGNTYTIQLGTFPAAGGGLGTFTILPAPAIVNCQYDDGTTENDVGLTAGGEMCWMHKMGTNGVATTVTSISTAWGSLAFPGAAPGNGTPANVAIWDDPNDDGDPRDAVLLQQVATVVANVDTDIFNPVALSPAVTANGVFFIGAAVVHASGQLPAPLDQSSCQVGSRVFLVGSTAGPLNYSNLTANNVPLDDPNYFAPGQWLLRATCTTEPGSGYCFGDNIDPNITNPCPCANYGAPGRGCASSFNSAGAKLTADGLPANEGGPVGGGVVLHGAGMNVTAGQFCIFLKGAVNATAGVVFGDGVRCADAPLIRMRTEPVTPNALPLGGTSSFPMAGDPQSLSDRGGTPVGGGLIGYYTVYYRNAAGGFCPAPMGGTFNTANGYKITW